MRLYDPAKGITYVHLAAQQPPRDDPSGADDVLDRLPAGYANQSPRTRVRSEAGTPDSSDAPATAAGVVTGNVLAMRPARA